MSEVDPSITPENQACIERNPELFWSTKQWGDKSGLSFEQFEYLWTSAQENYIDLPAHNFDHACDTLWDAMKLSDEYEHVFPNETPINRKILVATTLFHDAKFYEDHDALGYPSKEAHSAKIFEHIASKAGYDSDESQAVQDHILSTSSEAPLKTREAKIIAIADLHNVGENYWGSFRRKTEIFLEEAQCIQGKTFNHLKSRMDNMKIVASYLTKDLSLGGVERDWLQKARSNVRRAVGEFADEQNVSYAEMVKRLGSKAIERLLGDRHPKANGKKEA